MIHERVRNLGGQPLTGANKQASDLGLAKLELTEYDVENPLQHLPVTAKLVARVDKIRQQYLTSEVWATLRKSIDTALDKNKTIDKVVMLKFGTLAHITDEADAYIEEHFQRLGSTLGIAGQIRARRSGGSGVDGGAPVVQVQSIFYDHQFLPGDGRLLTGLGAKVVEYPDIITYIDHNALVIDNLLDRQLQPEFIIQSNPGILIGGQMERWAGDMQLDLMVKNYPEEQKEKLRADVLTFLKHRHVAPLADVVVPEIRTAFEDAKEPYEDDELVVYGRRGCGNIFWLDAETGPDTRSLGAIEKEVAVVEQADAAHKAMCDAEFADAHSEVIQEEQQKKIDQDTRPKASDQDVDPKGTNKVTQWVKERLGKVNQAKLSTWISDKLSSTKLK